MSTDLANSNVPLTDAQFPAPAYPVYRFSVEEYLQMADSGILARANVELLDGIIVPKMTRNSWHDAVIGRVQLLLITLLLNKPWTVRTQSALVATQSVPEPDVAIVRGCHDDYLTIRPSGQDAVLVIEVADSTVKVDRQKANIYAAAGVPQYWIFNANAQCIEVYEKPAINANGQWEYGPKRVVRGEEQLKLLVDGAEIARFTANQLVPPVSGFPPIDPT